MCEIVPNVLQERLARIEQEAVDEEKRQRQEALNKANRVENAERRKLGPVDDSQMVDEMFGFIDTQSDVSESAAPTAFRVSQKNLLYVCV